MISPCTAHFLPSLAAVFTLILRLSRQQFYDIQTVGEMTCRFGNAIPSTLRIRHREHGNPIVKYAGAFGGTYQDPNNFIGTEDHADAFLKRVQHPAQPPGEAYHK